MKVFVVDDHIDIDTNIVDDLDVNLFKPVGELGLVHKFLHGV